ncbi:MAG TPA: hypothetical protein VFW04_02130 [Gemmatimonadaceae bacterium]|nr:hypothetical protein [Gemmatimonadaceae bacterium]
MTDLLWHIALFCLPAPVVGIAAVALTRRLTWRRALLGALLAQWVIILGVAARAQIGFRACAGHDEPCLQSLAAPVSAQELTHLRLELLLVLGVGGTLSTLAVGALATLAVRRLWPPSIDRALS